MLSNNVCFLNTKPIKDVSRLIGNHYFMFYKITDLNFHEFSINLSYLGYERIYIFRVVSDSAYAAFLELNNNSSVMVESFSTPQNNQFELVLHTISLTELFHNEIFIDFVFNANFLSNTYNNFLFCFEGISYPELILHFGVNNVHVSGGSTIFRHIINPVKFKLGQIILAIEAGNPKGVSTSFKLKTKDVEYSAGGLKTFKLNATKMPLNLELFRKNIKND